MGEIDTNSDEFKQALQEAVAEATEGLKAKNSELLGKIKKLQQATGITPEDLAAVESERDTLKAELQAAKRELTKAQRAAEEAGKRAAEIDTAYSRSIADSALTEALTKAGVTNPIHLKATKALLSGQIAVVDEDGKRIVKAGDKALGDFIQEWASSDEGKHFVTAPDASGGGAQGARSTQTQTPGQLPPDPYDREARKAAIEARLRSAAATE